MGRFSHVSGCEYIGYVALHVPVDNDTPADPDAAALDQRCSRDYTCSCNDHIGLAFFIVAEIQFEATVYLIHPVDLSPIPFHADPMFRK